MTVTNQNASIYRGDTALLSIELTAADGQPFVLDPSDTVKYRVARNWYAAEEEALISKDLADGITFTDNVAAIEITSTDSNLFPGLYYHELKVETTDPDRSTAMVGTFIVRKALRMVPAAP